MQGVASDRTALIWGKAVQCSHRASKVGDARG